MSDAEILSNHFREMYDIPADVAVFDRAEECPRDGKMGRRYWVHVENASPDWERVMREDLEERGEPAIPAGFNNVVDVVEINRSSDHKVMVYMHYKPGAPGLPTDF